MKLRGALLAGALLASGVGCAAPSETAWAPPVTAPYPGYPSYPAYPSYARVPPPTPSAAGAYEWGRASYYSDRLAGHRTATGEPYDPRALTAAHRTLPLGSIVDVARADGRHVAVRINDRGPYARGRILDLSRRAAEEIGMVRDGVADVVLRVVWVPPRGG